MARQLWIERPVEFRQGKPLLETRLLVATLDEARLSPVEFVLQNQREGLQKWLLAPLGLQHACLERVAYA
ncbi:protein of unknown function [Caballeronia sp. S22]